MSKHQLLKILISKLKANYFYALLVYFVFSALWIAFSAIYPLPFDEYYHFGLIKLYAGQWSPFIYRQPQSVSILGDVTRTPSYLYHYLMSFPYRFMNIFISNENVKIVLLRLINIIFVILAIFIFRKLFVQAGISQKIINIVMTIFVITPITPFLAAHINYDNLLILITAVCFKLGYDLVHEAKPSVYKLLVFICLGMLGSLVKYNLLPIFAPLFLYVVISMYKTDKSTFFSDLFKNFKKLTSFKRFFIIVLLLFSFILFFERIGLNIIHYHKPEPSCEQLQPISVCKQNMPWNRNYQAKLIASTSKPPFGNPLSYTRHWFNEMLRGYFAIFSQTPTNVISKSEPFGPIVLKPSMPIPIVVGCIALIAGLICCLVYWRKLWQQKLLQMIILISACYLIILWAFNYISYLGTGQPYAIQARYTYPLLLPIILLLISAAKNIPLPRNYKFTTIVALILIYGCGAGVLGWIIRADRNWYWQNHTVISINQSAQATLKKVILH